MLVEASPYFRRGFNISEINSGKLNHGCRLDQFKNCAPRMSTLSSGPIAEQPLYDNAVHLPMNKAEPVGLLYPTCPSCEVSRRRIGANASIRV